MAVSQSVSHCQRHNHTRVHAPARVIYLWFTARLTRNRDRLNEPASRYQTAILYTKKTDESHRQCYYTELFNTGLLIGYHFVNCELYLNQGRSQEFTIKGQPGEEWGPLWGPAAEPQWGLEATPPPSRRQICMWTIREHNKNMEQTNVSLLLPVYWSMNKFTYDDDGRGACPVVHPLTTLLTWTINGRRLSYYKHPPRISTLNGSKRV